MYEDAVERRTAPALAELHERGEYRRAATVFPSLTPVCLSSLVDRRVPGRARDPAPRLVPPRRAAARRVRLVVRRAAPRGHPPRHPRRDLPHERGAPLAERGDALRVGRGRRSRRGRREHHLLPRTHAARRAHPRRDARRARAEAVLLLQPLRVRRDRCAVPAGRATGRRERQLRRRRRPLARDARRLRPARLLPAGLRLRVARGRAGRGARRARARRRRGARSARRRGWGRRAARALRGRRLLGPRADPRRPARRRLHRLVRAASTSSSSRASNRAGMVYDLRGGTRARARRAARRRPGGGDRALPRGRRARRSPRRRRGARLARPTYPDGLARATARACATRTAGTCSSRPLPATSSPTSPAGTTPAAAVTARSWPATPRCRCSRSGSEPAPGEHHRHRAARARPPRRRAPGVRAALSHA